MQVEIDATEQLGAIEKARASLRYEPKRDFRIRMLGDLCGRLELLFECGIISRDRADVERCHCDEAMAAASQMFTFPRVVGDGPGADWVAHAYPLKQLTIELQGTRHASRSDLLRTMQVVIARLEDGHVSGCSHDDDFGYRFEYDQATERPSIFNEAVGQH